MFMMTAGGPIVCRVSAGSPIDFVTAEGLLTVQKLNKWLKIILIDFGADYQAVRADGGN